MSVFFSSLVMVMAVVESSEDSGPEDIVACCPDPVMKGPMLSHNDIYRGICALGCA